MKLEELSKIGIKTMQRLNTYGIYTPEDLLRYFPKKYTLYECSTEHLLEGDFVCFKARIASRPAFIKYRRNVNAVVFYIWLYSQKIKCITFSGDYLRFKLNKDADVILYGRFKAENKEFVIQNIFFDDFICRIDTDYGLKDLNSKIIRQAVSSALQAGVEIDETLPETLIAKYRLLPMDQLLRKAHLPESREDCIEVLRRRKYEDFFWYACQLEALRFMRKDTEKPPKKWDRDLVNQQIKCLPYELTSDQMTALNTILSELDSSRVMNRLLQGDVGCGKSIVAFLSAIAAISAGYQVAIMAPTEILATQHYDTFCRLFGHLHLKTAFISSTIKQKDKEDVLYRLMHHRIDLLIGTHALIQSSVVFSKLGLVIIDEEHRFGVLQRKKLIEKFKYVDALYMTATPIPRTLGLTTFGDLDLSSIHTLPQHRKQVITELLLEEQLPLLKEILKKHLANGEQIFIVVPLIHESSALDGMDVKQAYDLFEEMLFPYRLACLHGKMKATEKRQLMMDFKNHRYDGLVATTVIEVGIDVADATVMLVLNAERYGLSQIHQLRGRVGRGQKQSYCYLVSSKKDIVRLQVLCQISDGFELAEQDLKLRGPGDYLGEEQSGFLLNFSSEGKDAVIFKYAQKDGRKCLEDYLNGTLQNHKIAEIVRNGKIKK